VTNYVAFIISRKLSKRDEDFGKKRPSQYLTFASYTLRCILCRWGCLTAAEWPPSEPHLGNQFSLSRLHVFGLLFSVMGKQLATSSRFSLSALIDPYIARIANLVGTGMPGRVWERAAHAAKVGGRISTMPWVCLQAAVEQILQEQDAIVQAKQLDDWQARKKSELEMVTFAVSHPAILTKSPSLTVY